MKKLILSASVILFVGLAAMAQDGTNNKKCEKKCDKKECPKDMQCGKKCDPKDCTTDMAFKNGEDKSCKHGSTACAYKKSDATKEEK